MFSKLLTPLDEAGRARRRRFWGQTRRRLFWMLALAVVLHTALNIYGSILLNREFTIIREKGEPLQWSELEPPKVPDNENAALLYDQAFAQLNFTLEPERAVGRPYRERKAKTLEEANATVHSNRQVLITLRRASALPHCVFPQNWKSNPVKWTFPYLRKFRDSGRLMAMSAEMEAERGNRALALQDVRSIFQMSNHLAEQPFIICFQSAVLLDSIANNTLARILEKDSMNVREAHAFLASLPKVDWVKVFQNDLLGERTFGNYLFSNLDRNEGAFANDEYSPWPFWLRLPWRWLCSPILKLDQAKFLSLWRGMLYHPAALQVPRPPGFNASQDQAIVNIPSYARVTRVLLPIYSLAAEQRDCTILRRRQLEVALALESYRARYKKYPRQLDQAAREWEKPLPLDFYSGKPFQYRPDGQSYSLYSFGPNRTDQKGKSPEILKGWGPNDDDVVWVNSWLRGQKQRARK